MQFKKDRYKQYVKGMSYNNSNYLLLFNGVKRGYTEKGVVQEYCSSVRPYSDLAVCVGPMNFIEWSE